MRIIVFGFRPRTKQVSDPGYGKFIFDLAPNDCMHHVMFSLLLVKIAK